MGCGRAEVGADQCSFQIIERGAVDLFAKSDHFLDAISEVLTGASNRFLHAIEEAWSLFFVQTAKQSLNHENREPRISISDYSVQEGRGSVSGLLREDQNRLVSTPAAAALAAISGVGCGTGGSGSTGRGTRISPRW